MSSFLLELKLQKCTFEFDEFHLTHHSKSKVFSSPLSICSLDIHSKLSQVPFEFTLKSKVILEGKLDPKSAKSCFSGAQGVFVEFSVEVHDLLKSNFKKNQDSFLELKDSLKLLNQARPEAGLSTNNDFSQFFQSSFQDFSLPQYAQFLESVIQGLGARLKVFESGSFGKFSSVQEKSSENFNLRTNSNELKKERNEEGVLLQTQLEDSSKELTQLKAQFLLKVASEGKLVTENQLLRGDLLKNKADQRNFDLASKSLKESRELQKAKDEIIENLKKKFESQAKSHQEGHKALEKTLQDLQSENLKLIREVHCLNNSVELLKSSSDQLLADKKRLESELFQEQLSAKVQKSMNDEFSKTDSQLIKDLLLQIENLKETLKQNNKSHKEEVSTWAKKCKELEIRALASQKAGVREQTSHIKGKLSGNFENTLKNASSLFETLIEDSKTSLKNVKDIDFRSVFENSSIYEHSEKLSRKLLDYSKTILYYQNVLTKVVEVLRELKSENFALRERLFFSQNSLPLYIPVRGDPLDFAMAEFVNNLKRPLKIPFVRQDPGFYLFGSRNIKIRLVKNKPFIYAPEPVMVIDEFVNRFTKEEILKFEEQKKLDDKRIASEASKFTSGESVIESSPLTPALSTSAFSANRSVGSFKTYDLIPKTGTHRSSHSRKFSDNLPNRLLKKN